VAARIIEIETGLDWYYVVCTKCASTLTVVEGKLVCQRCKIKCNAIPRSDLYLLFSYMILFF
jgi:hypothetical protein